MIEDEQLDSANTSGHGPTVHDSGSEYCCAKRSRLARRPADVLEVDRDVEHDDQHGDRHPSGHVDALKSPPP